MDAYDYPNINLTRHIQDPEHLTLPLHFTYSGTREYAPEVDRRKYEPAYLINADEDNDKIFTSEDLRHWPSSGHAETVFLSSNRGRVVKLFSNPHHLQQLYGMGLRPDTIFACGFKYLFEPNAAVKAQFQQHMDAVQASPLDLKIGVMIRAGDAVFTGGSIRDNLTTRYISCALEVETNRKGADQGAVWSVPTCHSCQLCIVQDVPLLGIWCRRDCTIVFFAT